MLKTGLIALVLCSAAVSARAQTPALTPLEKSAIERRATEAFIWGLPAVNYDLMLQEMLAKTSAKVNQVVFWGGPMGPNNQTLTPNPDTLYFMVFFDTRGGPIVLDLPRGDANGSFNGNIVTLWQVPLEDAGLLGYDKGAGAKYLISPPGYTGAKPEGYVPLQSDTYGGFALIRANLDSYSEADVAKSLAYGKKLKVYPLSQAKNPPATVFTDAKDVVFDATIRYEASFFEHLDRIVQSEPWLARDRAMIDPLKTIGIEKGQPYKPSAAVKALLDSAARSAQLWLKARYDAGALPAFFPGKSRWMAPATPDLVRAYASGLADPDSYPIDARALVYTLGFVGVKRLGTGQMYLLSIKDKDGKALAGGTNYRLRVPPNVPVEQYWSITAYDRETHALIRNMPRASRSSHIPELQKNADGSVDLYFGPKPPRGLESNWVPTDPARKFELMFRAYAPTKALFEKTWVLPDVERAPAR